MAGLVTCTCKFDDDKIKMRVLLNSHILHGKSM